MVAGPDVLGPVISLGYNLIGQTDGSTGWRSTDLTGTSAEPLDPLLGPLQDNGGPTQTQAPLVGSPAIGPGDPSLDGSVDQRGSLRGWPFPLLTSAPAIGAVQTLYPEAYQIIAPAEVVRGQPFQITLVAMDRFSNLSPTFTGTVHFSSTDLDAQLPDDTAFPADAAGVVTVTATLNTAGAQTIAVKDLTLGYIGGRATVVVQDASAPFATTGLTWDLVAWQFDATGWHSRH